MSSTGRPLMPPVALARSTAICTPTSAVLPPAAAVPDSGCSVPILYSRAWPNASRHGAGTSIAVPRALAAVDESARNFRRVVLPLHHMDLAQDSSCQRPVMPASFGVAPIYANRSDRARAPGSERARVRPAVDQEVSARDEARVGAADERAELAELRRVAEATGGGGSVPVTHDFLDGATARLGLDGDGRAQPVGVEGAGQEVVDRDVVADGLAREPRDEPREPGARSVREPQDVDGVLHGARRDIDDAAEAARDHGVHGRRDEEDPREHVRVERLDPSVAVPLAEVAGRRTTRVVDEDVGRWARGEQRRAPGLGRDVAGDGGHADARGIADLFRGRLEHVLRAGHHRDVHALAGERHGARLSQPTARGADDRVPAPDPEVHRPLLYESPLSTPATW